MPKRSCGEPWQAVPHTSGLDYQGGILGTLLQLVVGLTSGLLSATTMLSRGRDVDEGRQICVGLSGRAAYNQAQHRYISSNTKRCELVIKKRVALSVLSCAVELQAKSGSCCTVSPLRQRDVSSRAIAVQRWMRRGVHAHADGSCLSYRRWNMSCIDYLVPLCIPISVLGTL